MRKMRGTHASRHARHVHSINGTMGVWKGRDCAPCAEQSSQRCERWHLQPESPAAKQFTRCCSASSCRPCLPLMHGMPAHRNCMPVADSNCISHGHQTYRSTIAQVANQFPILCDLQCARTRVRGKLLLHAHSRCCRWLNGKLTWPPITVRTNIHLHMVAVNSAAGECLSCRTCAFSSRRRL